MDTEKTKASDEKQENVYVLYKGHLATPSPIIFMFVVFLVGLAGFAIAQDFLWFSHQGQLWEPRYHIYGLWIKYVFASLFTIACYAVQKWRMSRA